MKIGNGVNEGDSNRWIEVKPDTKWGAVRLQMSSDDRMVFGYFDNEQSVEIVNALIDALGNKIEVRQETVTRVVLTEG